MNKLIFLFAVCLIHQFSIGQEKDTRAVLNIQGGLGDLAVSPNEALWLMTSKGNVYTTTSIDSNWTYPDGPYGSNTNAYNNGKLGRINFFNTDIAIMSGYISTKEKGGNKNGVFRTIDGGKTWKLLSFSKKGAWIYDAFVDKNGNAWMGGSSGEIFYSNDFGATWEKRKSPFNHSSRVNSIFMLDDQIGYAGALHNDIYFTADNWNSSIRIESPFDQREYENGSDYSQNKINKFRHWNSYLIVKQQGRVFCASTATSQINWTKLPAIIDFEVDPIDGSLFAINSALQIVKMESPRNLILFQEQPLKNRPYNMQIVNNTVYVMDQMHIIYRITASENTSTLPYTTEHKIEEPNIIVTHDNYRIGATGGNLYLSADKATEWYRENTFNFIIADISVLNKNELVLWDGKTTNYLYNLDSHTYSTYNHPNPLGGFLKSPLQSFMISSCSQGCYHFINESVIYEKHHANKLKATSYIESHYSSDSIKKFNHQVDPKELLEILADIDDNPSKIPTLAEFQISDDEIQTYLSDIEQQYKKGKITDTDYSYYIAFPEQLDTISQETVKALLTRDNFFWSTTRNYFDFEMANQKGDTVRFEHNSSLSTAAYNLPWLVTYNEMHFNCYSVALSMYLAQCLPDGFFQKTVLSNAGLIRDLANLCKP